MNSGTDNQESTREVILHTIKSSNQASVGELAEVANVSPVTVRHHLNSLQAEGLLVTKTIRRKVGRPYYVYSLSEKGHELFPQRYMRLSSRLLDELKARFPAETVVELLRGAGQRLIEEHKEAFEDEPFEKRLIYLTELLAEEGFLAAWEKTEDGYRLVEYSCPYISVGHKHVEVCSFDKELMTIVLSTKVEQHSCMLHGDTCCQFSFAPSSEEDGELVKEKV